MLQPIMKKIFTIIALLFIVNLYGDASNSQSYYTNISKGITFVENDYGLKEPLKNIVGGESQRLELEVGVAYKNAKVLGVDNKVFMFLYGWRYDKVKYNELGFGLGTKWQSTPLKIIPLRLYFMASGGIGEQNNKGKEFFVETNSNAISYVTGNVQHGYYKAKFTEDSYVIEFNIGTGVTIDITDNVSLNAGYQYQQRNYQYSYKIEGAGVNTHLSGVIQNGHTIKIGMDIMF